MARNADRCTSELNSESSLFNTFLANLSFILNNLDIKNHEDDTPVSNNIDDLT